MSEASSKNLSETLFQNHKQAKETSSLTQYMPSSLELLDTRREQSSQAWYRNLRRLQWIWQGVDPVEQEEIWRGLPLLSIRALTMSGLIL